MIEKVLQYIEKFELINSDDHILIAVSGGADSMALLHMLSPYPITVAHVNHMLRGSASDADEELVANYCSEHQIPFYSKKIPIQQIVEQEQGNVQAICRRERYAFFKKVYGQIGATKLATAHHADDQLESIMMALIHDATPTSMQGIQPIRTLDNMSVIRPLLALTKQEIYHYMLQHHMIYREDKSNEANYYLRNRVRHQLIPFMQQENPAIAENILYWTTLLREDQQYLDQQASELFPAIITQLEDECYKIDIVAFKNEPLALQRRIVLILLTYIYSPQNVAYRQTSLQALLTLCQHEEGSEILHLPNGWQAKRSYHAVHIMRGIKVQQQKTQILQVNEWLDCQHGIALYVTDKQSMPNDTVARYYFNSKQLQLPFTVRARQDGDRIQLKGMASPKRLSRLFIDEKIPIYDRDSIPLIIANGEVVAVCGVRMGGYFSTVPRAEDDMVLLVKAVSR